MSAKKPKVAYVPIPAYTEWAQRQIEAQQRSRAEAVAAIRPGDMCLTCGERFPFTAAGKPVAGQLLRRVGNNGFRHEACHRRIAP